MINAEDSPAKLIEVPTEQEAAIIVAMLTNQGISARAVGGFTSGFRAEAPGSVEIWVTSSDLAASLIVIGETSDPDAANADAEEESAKFDLFLRRGRYREHLYVFAVVVAPLLLSLLVLFFNS